jgi:hypothetical protein
MAAGTKQPILQARAARRNSVHRKVSWPGHDHSPGAFL